MEILITNVSDIPFLEVHLPSEVNEFETVY